MRRLARSAAVARRWRSVPAACRQQPRGRGQGRRDRRRAASCATRRTARLSTPDAVLLAECRAGARPVRRRRQHRRRARRALERQRRRPELHLPARRRPNGRTAARSPPQQVARLLKRAARRAQQEPAQGHARRGRRRRRDDRPGDRDPADRAAPEPAAAARPARVRDHPQRHGTGPFSVAPSRRQRRRAAPDARDRLRRRRGSRPREEVLLDGRQRRAGRRRASPPARPTWCSAARFADLPFAQRVKLPRGSLRFDPASGLFGLVPLAPGGALDDPDLRRLLSQAIDRDALIAALGVPGLAPRATLLEPGLDGVPAPGRAGVAGDAARRPPAGAAAPRPTGCSADSEAGRSGSLLPDGPGRRPAVQRAGARLGRARASRSSARRARPRPISR